MKKLMIAAAAAAMISGGAYANLTDLGTAGTAYNLTYNLKTTVGATKKATVNYYLGAIDAASTQIWYQDPAIAPEIAADLATTTKGYVHLFQLKNIAGRQVPCLTAAGKKDPATLFILMGLATTDKTGRNADGAKYGFKSANKWCDTFTVQDEYCYRTAGTVKTTGIYIDDCCLVTGSAGGFVHIFGAPLLASSKKVEFYQADAVAAGFMPLLNDGVTPADVKDSKKLDRVIQVLAVAGQGAYGTVKANDGTGTLANIAGVTSISGSAVGTCDAQDCKSCCLPGTIPQFVWDCVAGAPVPAGDNSTAAYGTFTFKYNAAFTK